MKGICPICEAKRELEAVTSMETIKVRGESFEVESKHLKCLTCGGDFDDPRSDDDPVSKAYREYRKHHGMVQPEDLRAFRKKYGLTQAGFSEILGWGIATLNRYENGALQSAAHGKEFKLAMEPHNLLRLINESPEALSESKRRRIIEKLEREEQDSCSPERFIESNFLRYEPSENSGYKKFLSDKFSNAVLFFCKNGGELKTKLNKLLFYADFSHFKNYATSITGAQYARIKFGPVPDNYDFYFATFIKQGYLDVNEQYYPQGYGGEIYVSAKEPDLGVFSDSELKTLTTVKEFFKDFNATEIKEFSHDEDGYKNTSNGDLITYAYAKSLHID